MWTGVLNTITRLLVLAHYDPILTVHLVTCLISRVLRTLSYHFSISCLKWSTGCVNFSETFVSMYRPVIRVTVIYITFPFNFEVILYWSGVVLLILILLTVVIYNHSYTSLTLRVCVKYIQRLFRFVSGCGTGLLRWGSIKGFFLFSYTVVFWMCHVLTRIVERNVIGFFTPF